MFSFFAEPEPHGDPSQELFLLLIWLANHPKWLRRDRAAAALAWIIRDVPSFIEKAATRAFVMTEGYGTDVLCGVLGGLSNQRPVELWEKLSPHLQLDAIV